SFFRGRAKLSRRCPANGALDGCNGGVTDLALAAGQSGQFPAVFAEPDVPEYGIAIRYFTRTRQFTRCIGVASRIEADVFGPAVESESQVSLIGFGAAKMV